MEEIKALLLAHEQRLDKQHVVEEAASLNLTQTKTPSSSDASQLQSQPAPQANFTGNTLSSENSQALGLGFRGNSQFRGRGGRSGRRGGRGGGRFAIQC